MEAGRRCKNEEGWKRGKRNKFEGMRGMRVKVEKQKWRNVEWGGKKEGARVAEASAGAADKSRGQGRRLKRD